MRKNIFLTGLVFGAVFAFMFALNHFMPLHRDDYDYAMIWKTGVHLASLSDVVSSGVQHYLLHGGRVVTVFFLQLFLWLGKPIFDAANALMFIALTVLVAMHARRCAVFWDAPKIFAASALLLWLALPHFGEVAVWKSGSTVYLWSAVPAFSFLLPYNVCLRQFSEGHRARHRWAICPMFLLGVLAGWSIENLAVTVVMVACGAAFYAAHRYGACPAWMVSGAFGALIGFIGLVAAPGNYVRYEEQGEGKGLLAHIANQFAGQGEMLLYLLPVLLIIVTAWRICRLLLAGVESTPAGRPGKGMIVFAAVLGLFVLSYFTGGWAAAAMRDAVIGGILTPLGLTKPLTIHLFTNVMNGFEEMAIYWFTIFLFYERLKQQLGLGRDVVRKAAARVSGREVLRRSPAVRYAAILMLLGIFNNLVMLAAPTFPGRATFSSTAMFVAAALALSEEEAFHAMLRGTAALLITRDMGAADAARIAWIEEARTRGATTVCFPRIESVNRALRHVYYEDWDNKVTKHGAMTYFGLTDVIVGVP